MLAGLPGAQEILLVDRARCHCFTLQLAQLNLRLAGLALLDFKLRQPCGELLLGLHRALQVCLQRLANAVDLAVDGTGKTCERLISLLQIRMHGAEFDRQTVAILFGRDILSTQRG